MGEGERETHKMGCLPRAPQQGGSGDLGRCSRGKWRPGRVGVQDSAPTDGATQPGPRVLVSVYLSQTEGTPGSQASTD